MTDLRLQIVLYLGLVASLSLHEWAHAWTAHKLGDDTAYNQGRVTLNPLSHIDPIGTVLIPWMMILLSPGFALIGWAKPVPVNLANFKHRTLGDIVVSMAGPLMNLLICLVLSLLGAVAMGTESRLEELVKALIFLNALLFVFNLLPIPPLDGSHVARHLFRISEEFYIKACRWGPLVLLLMINLHIVFRSILQVAMLTMYPFIMLMDYVAGFIDRS